MNLNKIFPQNSKRRKIAKTIYYKIFSKYSKEEMDYKKWINENEPNAKELKLQKNFKFDYMPKISIVVPMYNTPKKFFKELVESLKKQTYSNWELDLADGSPKKLEFLEKYLKDERIKYKFLNNNYGISGNTNEAIKLATGDFIGLLDHDDLLPAFSLFEVVKSINENSNVEFLYSDEDKLETKNGPRFGAFFKPDFSQYTLNSANYICHFTVLKKSLVDKLGGFKKEFDGSQDFDIVARASEETSKIVHIPKILYHWRAHQNSTAQNSNSKPYAFEIGKKVIKEHIKRSIGKDVEISDGLTPGSYEIKYPVIGKPKVGIIIEKNNMDISKFNNIKKELEKSKYENYEIITIDNCNLEKINEEIEKSDFDFFMIVDKELEKVDRENYIEDLLGICQNENVGIVGSKLYNNAGNVEHSGIIIGMNGIGDFLFKGVPKDIGTYMQRLMIIHNVSCVYYKYSLINSKTFKKFGGFDTKKEGIAISIDLCLNILSINNQVILNPIISFLVDRLEDDFKNDIMEKNILEKWNVFYKTGDIYFSPNLSKKSTGLYINI